MKMTEIDIPAEQAVCALTAEETAAVGGGLTWRQIKAVLDFVGRLTNHGGPGLTV